MRILTAAFITSFAGPAFAQCQSGMETFMSCTFQNGAKSVQVCANGSTASYNFGPRNGPSELALTVPVSEVDYLPWPGAGSSIFESVIFFNNNIAYEVFASADRQAVGNKRHSEIYGGIVVSEKGNEIATLNCDAGSVEFPWSDVLSR